MHTEVSFNLISSTEGTKPVPSSCGLDVWQYDIGFRWTCRYMRGHSAHLHIVQGSKEARLRLLLRKTPVGIHLASSYPYGCIEGDVDLFWANAKEISNTLAKSRIACLEVPFSGEYAVQVSNEIEFRALNLDAVRHLLNLSEYDTSNIEHKFHPNIRWALRKAARNGCRVRRATLEDVDQLQSLYLRTMRSKRAPVNYGRERFHGIVDDLEQVGKGCVYLGEIGGVACGMAAVVDGKISRHLIQLAVPPDYHKSRIGELLVATAIKEAVHIDLQFFDFMASAASDKGLIAFKGKWGGVQQPIQYSIIPGMAGTNYLVRLARWMNKVGARFYGQSI